MHMSDVCAAQIQGGSSSTAGASGSVQLLWSGSRRSRACCWSLRSTAQQHGCAKPNDQCYATTGQTQACELHVERRAQSLDSCVACCNPACIQQAVMPSAFAPIVDKAELELFVGNTPPTTSEFVLINFLNAAMAQVRHQATRSQIRPGENQQIRLCLTSSRSNQICCLRLTSYMRMSLRRMHSECWVGFTLGFYWVGCCLGLAA